MKNNLQLDHIQNKSPNLKKFATVPFKLYQKMFGTGSWFQVCMKFLLTVSFHSTITKNMGLSWTSYFE